MSTKVIGVTKEQKDHKEELYNVISKQVLSSYWKYSLVNILQKYADSTNSVTMLCAADVEKDIDADSWSKLLQYDKLLQSELNCNYNVNLFTQIVAAVYKRLMPQQELPDNFFHKLTVKETNTLRIPLLIFSTQYQETALKAVHLSQETQWNKQLHEKKQHHEREQGENKSDEAKTETKVLSVASLNLPPLKLFLLRTTHALVAVSDFKIM